MSPFYLSCLFLLACSAVLRSNNNVVVIFFGSSDHLECQIKSLVSPSLICFTLPLPYICFNRHLLPTPPSRPNFALSILLLLAGDIATNPGPISSFLPPSGIIPLSSNSNKVKVGLSNARSLNNKTAVLSDLIFHNNFDILGLTETWLKPDTSKYFLSDLTPKGYNLTHKPRPTKRGGGVAFMISEMIKTSSFSIPDFTSFESIAIRAEINGRQCLFICIYRPPEYPAESFFEEINSLLENIYLTNFEIFVMGDFNLHLDRDSVTTDKFNDTLNSYDMKQWVTFPTTTFGHWLDLFITKETTNSVKAITHCNGISDHFTVIAFLNFDKPKHQKERIQYRQIHKIDLSKFHEDITKSDLILNPADDLDKLCSQYNLTLRSILDNHAPVITKFVPKKSPAPWMTKEIVEAKTLRRKYERTWRKTRSGYDRSKFTAQSNFVNRIIERAKQNYLSAFIERNSNNPNNLWKSLNKIMHRKPPVQLPDNDNLPELCNTFSNYFVTKIAKIRENFIPNDSVFPFSESKHIKDKLSTFSPVTKEYIKKLIMKSSNASSELDPIPTSLLKSSLEILINPITQIVNKSLSSGRVPEIFKLAHVKPLLKKPSLEKNNLKNYRPVSNLSFISKILEKAIFHQLQEHLTSNDLVNSYQSAYKKHHSTETALLKLHNDINLNNDRGMVTALVLLDLSAAFDTIDHTTLLRLLKLNFGIQGTAWEWFLSYLTHRTQMVKINEHCSNTVDLMYGVPQGSVLGPILFTLYTSPLSDLIRKNNIKHLLYADDTQLYINLDANNVDKQLLSLKNCIENISIWMNRAKLKLNGSKTEFMVFGSKTMKSKLENFFPLRIFDTDFKPMEPVRNLGVLFDSNFSFKPHISSIIKKCFMCVRDLRRARKFLPLSAAKTLAVSLISSRLDYCNSLLINLPNREIMRLQRLQNCVARVTMRAPRFSPSLPLLKRLHWLPIAFRIKHKLCSIGYQALLYKQPQYLFNTISYLQETRSLRSSGKKLLLRSKVKTVAGSKAFCNAFPCLWNALPDNLRKTMNYNLFKSRLKTYLFDLAFPP